jgi:hypothetical protein
LTEGDTAKYLQPVRYRLARETRELTRNRSTARAAFALAVATSVLVLASPALAVPPANDNFANRQDLGSTLTPSASGSNVDATKEPGEPNHQNDFGGASIWFGWTPPATGLYRLTSCTSDFHNLFSIYSGSTLSALGNEFPGIGPNCSSAYNPAFYGLSGTKGHELKIAIDGERGFSGPAEGSISFSYAPTDDIFAASTNLGNSTTASATQYIGGYSKEPGEPDHAGNSGGHSAWYSWTAPNSGRYLVDLCGSDFDTLLGIYTGAAVDSLTPVTSNDDACGSPFDRSRLAFTPTAGTTYRIAVDGATRPFANPAIGTLDLKITRVLADAFADAQDLGNGTSVTATGTNLGASKESGEPNHGGNVGGASIWYGWTAPQTDTVTIDTCGSAINTLLGVYTGSAVNNLTAVADNDDVCGIGSAVTFAASAGTTYWIAVDGFKHPSLTSPSQGSFGLHLNVGPPPDADGDGALDFADNCPSDANPDQADLDNDGNGDVCDSDVDGDTVDNEDDFCPEEWGESFDGCPLRYLALHVSGPGALAVTDFLGTYFCPDDFCNALYDDGDQALIEPVPDPDAQLVTFLGGGCSVSTPSCLVTFDTDQNVLATFAKPPVLTQPPTTTPPTRKKCKHKSSRKHRRCKKKRKVVSRLRAS